MKKLLTTLFLITGLYFLVFAGSVDKESARTAAINQLNYFLKVDASDITLAQIIETKTISSFNPNAIETHPLIYIFNIGDNDGFILISGDNIAAPVLGYSLNNSYQPEELPYNFRKWIEGYKNHILWAMENKIESTEDVSDMWTQLLSGNIKSPAITTVVSPLCTTTWDQSPYYNAMCPGGSVTGCVATAMAQVMKYWNHPAQGTGMHSYNHSVYGTLSADFGATYYQWSSMPDALYSNNNAIATLMYHCGVSVDMNYSPQESGAFVIEDDSPVCSESAFKNYFGYSSDLHGDKRDWYTTSQWTQMLNNDLNNGRPLVYAGFGTGGGHAFVCDGYNDGDYYHFNWGWGGAYDGFFYIDALDPGGTGTGGGSGGFNSGHQAIFNMSPSTTTSSYDLQLYSQSSVSPNPIEYGEGFTVQAQIGNYGDNNFSGDFTAWVFDANMNAIDNVDIISTSLTSGYYNTYSFSTSGMSSLLPGSYSISIYYRESGGEWIRIGDGSFSNSISFTVGNESSIELYSDFYLTCGTTITINDPFTVYVDIANYGTSTFYGMFDVSLYDLDGYFVTTIQTLTGAALDPDHYYEDVEFATYGVDIDPGTYLLALQHQPTGGNWELSGSTYYSNPIQVIVKEAGMQQDVYEPNNVESEATLLSATFVGDRASVYTTGSNINNTSDYDFYYLNLPSGYQYSITARAHDSYNSGNGQVYTCDVLWSYDTGLFWSLAYDDVMQGTIEVNNGGQVMFLVSPYFLGETGTYLMDLQIVRSALGVDQIEQNSIDVFPVPVTDIVNFKSDDKINSVTIYDVTGKIVSFTEFDGVKKASVNMNSYDNGTYFAVIKNDKLTLKRSFIKL